MNLLSQDEILALHQAAVVLGLNRDTLLSGLHRGFVGSLRSAGSTSTQLLMDLYALNRIEKLMDGTVPLLIWLQNASHLSSYTPEGDVFRDVLEKLKEKGGQQTSTVSEKTEERGSDRLSEAEEEVSEQPSEKDFRFITDALKPFRRAGCNIFWEDGLIQVKAMSKLFDVWKLMELSDLLAGVQSLNLDGCQLGPRDFQMFLKHPLDALKHLSLAENKLEHASFAALTRTSYFPQLETLVLRSNNIKNLGEESVGEFPNGIQLKALNLDDNGLYDADLGVLLACGLLENIEVLELRENYITDKGAKLLVDYEDSFRSLKSLNLWSNRVGEEGQQRLELHFGNELKQGLNLKGQEVGEPARLFIDMQPYPFDSPEGQKLHQILKETYNGVSSLVSLVERVGIQKGDLHLSQAPTYIWRDVIELAGKRGRLRQLLREVLGDKNAAARHDEIRSLLGLGPGEFPGL